MISPKVNVEDVTLVLALGGELLATVLAGVDQELGRQLPAPREWIRRYLVGEPLQKLLKTVF